MMSKQVKGIENIGRFKSYRIIMCKCLSEDYKNINKVSISIIII